MNQKIRIGQIGLAHAHGEGKMNAVRKFPELFEVVGFCESNDELVEKSMEKEVYKGLKRMSEEELLENELEGYSEYKSKVKYRLIPFIW